MVDFGSEIILPTEGLLFDRLREAGLLAVLGEDGVGDKKWPIWGRTDEDSYEGIKVRIIDRPAD